MTQTFDDFDKYIAAVDNFETGWGSVPVNFYSGGTVQTDHSQSYRYQPNIVKHKGYMHFI